MSRAAAAPPPPLTNVLFLSPSCREEYRAEEEQREDTEEAPAPPRGGRLLVAASDIPKGSLILLEHALTVPMVFMREMLRHDGGAFDRLYPRRRGMRWADYADKNSPEMDAMIAQKIACNAIGEPSSLMMLALGFSAINHAYPSNCVMRQVRLTESPFKDDLVLTFLCINAKRNIKAGEEITVTYSTVAPEDHPFIRTIPEEEVKKEIAFEEEVLKNCGLHFRAIDQYLEKKSWVETSVRHKLLLNGIIVTPSSLAISEAYMKGIPESLKEYLVESLVHEKGRKEGEAVVTGGTLNSLEMEALFTYERERTTQICKDFNFREESQ